MKTLAEKLERTIKKENKINSKDKDFKEIEKIIEKMNELGYDRKAFYSFPLVDTIGKNTYSILNK